MTQIYALIGSPGAKAQPSFTGTRHAITKRRRGRAGEPVLPGEALQRGGVRGAASEPAHSLGQPAIWRAGSLHHIGELATSAMSEKLLPHCVRDLFLPCWRTSHLCHEEFSCKCPPTFYFLTSPPTTLLRDLALTAPAAWSPSPLDVH